MVRDALSGLYRLNTACCSVGLQYLQAVPQIGAHAVVEAQLHGTILQELTQPQRYSLTKEAKANLTRAPKYCVSTVRN